MAVTSTNALQSYLFLRYLQSNPLKQDQNGQCLPILAIGFVWSFSVFHLSTRWTRTQHFKSNQAVPTAFIKVPNLFITSWKYASTESATSHPFASLTSQMFYFQSPSSPAFKTFSAESSHQTMSDGHSRWFSFLFQPKGSNKYLTQSEHLLNYCSSLSFVCPV